jgi:hypothetical protein
MLQITDTIKFKAHTIYKVKIDGVDINELKDDILEAKKIYVGDKLFNDLSTAAGPGVQFFTEGMVSKELTKLIDTRNDNLIEIHNSFSKSKIQRIYKKIWAYMAYSELKDNNYHDHLIFDAALDDIVGTYTWTYYVQMPNNLTDNDGKLVFKNQLEDSEEDTLSILPEEGYMYMFPSSLWHKPELSPNSTIPRIVLASNIYCQFFPDSKKML